MAINVFKREQNLKISPQCKAEEGTFKERQSTKYVGLSEQQDVHENERRDAELMTREETGRARGVGVEGHVKETPGTYYGNKRRMRRARAETATTKRELLTDNIRANNQRRLTLFTNPAEVP
jgi:hypothetical protein